MIYSRPQRETQLLTKLFPCREAVCRSLSFPFEQDGFIVATDTRCIIRIRKSASYVDAMPFNSYKIAKTFPPEFEKSEHRRYGRAQIMRALARLDMIDDADLLGVNAREVCPECDGCSQVTWEYRDRHFNRYEKDGDCPNCYGSGFSDTGKDAVIEFLNPKMVFNAQSILKLYAAMRYYGAAYCDLTSRKNERARFKLTDDVEMVIMETLTASPDAVCVKLKSLSCK